MLAHSRAAASLDAPLRPCWSQGIFGPTRRTMRPVPRARAVGLAALVMSRGRVEPVPETRTMRAANAVHWMLSHASVMRWRPVAPWARCWTSSAARPAALLALQIRFYGWSIPLRTHPILGEQMRSAWNVQAVVRALSLLRRPMVLTHLKQCMRTLHSPCRSTTHISQRFEHFKRAEA